MMWWFDSLSMEFVRGWIIEIPTIHIWGKSCGFSQLFIWEMVATPVRQDDAINK
jgi:hypothetical protein